MPELPRFANLTLILTEQCNLRCAYCYVPKTGRVMSESLALHAADFLLDRAPEGQDLSLSFFGGEPFLARALMCMPGLCDVEPDQGRQKDLGGPGGLCPPPPGLCPWIQPDQGAPKKDVVPGPGLCPTPGLC